MTKDKLHSNPGYFDQYINLVTEHNLFDAFADADQELRDIDVNLFKKIGHKIYQADKWTIPDILQHIIDTERIMTYRALCYSRHEKNTPIAFDEDAYATMASANKRSIEELLEELRVIRKGSLLLFRSFDDNQILRSGLSMQQELSVLALGFVILGHQRHHLNVITERYLPLFYS